MSEIAGGGVIGDSDVNIAPVSGLLLGNDDAARMTQAYCSSPRFFPKKTLYKLINKIFISLLHQSINQSINQCYVNVTVWYRFAKCTAIQIGLHGNL